MSTVDSRENALAGLIHRTKMWLAGVQHGGRRDLYELFGYKRNPTQLDYAARYLRQDITKRIVNAPILATWSDPPDIVADSAFQDAWNTLEGNENLRIYHNLIRLEKLSALGQFAIMICGFNDGGRLDSPVNPGKQNTLLYLQPYAETGVKVKTYDTNQQSPRFGKPIVYTVTPGRFKADQRIGALMEYSTSSNQKSFDVHFSRVLHVAEELLEDSVFGRSRLENVVNLLDDCIKVAGGGAEIFWLTANRGMQIDVDKEMELDPEDAEQLTKEIEEYQNDLRRFVRTRGTTIKELGSSVADPRGVFDVVISLISSATGIPKMVLLGSTTGQMASQQDRASWAERVTERITEFTEPVVMRPFLQTLTNANVLPKPTGLEINWQEAFKLSPLERAQTSAQMARSAANLTKTVSLLQPKGKTTIGADGSQVTEPTPAIEPLFNRDEMRRMVGFGKRMPVFDDTTNSPTSRGPNAKKTPPSTGTSAST